MPEPAKTPATPSCHLSLVTYHSSVVIWRPRHYFFGKETERMNWTQVYDPMGAWWLSTLVAALPVVVLLGLLAVFRVKPHWAALFGALTAIACASLVFQMPWRLSAASLGFGAAFGILKIAWIVVAAVFLYDVTVYTGQFEIMKSSVARI